MSVWGPMELPLFCGALRWLLLPVLHWIVRFVFTRYVIKCIMRTVVFLGPQIAPVAAMCLQRLSEILLKASTSGQHPVLG